MPAGNYAATVSESCFRNRARTFSITSTRRANVQWAARQRRGGSRARVDIDSLLGAVGLGAASERRVRELSGGEQQRLAVACALAGEPELVILDEPTASLDRAGAAALVEVLAGVAAHGSTMVIASHDHMVIDAGDLVVELNHGRRVR